LTTLQGVRPVYSRMWRTARASSVLVTRVCSNTFILLELEKNFGAENMIPLGMGEPLIAVTEEDRVVGMVTKGTSHARTTATLHRAFSLLVFSEDGERLLVQRRSADKVLFPLAWANTCCSHPHHSDLEMEPGWGVKRAAVRKARQELGLRVRAEDMTCVARILYRAACDAEWEEWELDHILCMHAPAEAALAPNPEEVCEARWVTRSELAALHRESSLSPWFALMAEHMLHSWWGKQSFTTNEEIRHFGRGAPLQP